MTEPAPRAKRRTTKATTSRLLFTITETDLRSLRAWARAAYPDDAVTDQEALRRLVAQHLRPPLPFADDSIPTP